MSLTGRPSRPPLALTSSSQIFCASKADLPLAARPPVIAMLKPILIGSPDCATARSAASATTATAAADTAPINDLNRDIIGFLPLGRLPCSDFLFRGHTRAIPPSGTRAGPAGPANRHCG